MAAAKSSGSFTSACYLVLEGADPIPVTQVEGGALVGDVAINPAGATAHKHVSVARTSDVSFDVGVPLPAALQTWLASILAGTAARRSGAFVLVDHAQRVRERRLFIDALPVQLALPALEASGKSPFRLRLTLAVPALATVKGDNAKLMTAIGKKAKAAVTGNFRLVLGKLPTGRLATIEAEPLTIELSEKGQLHVQPPDLRLRLGTPDIEAWRTYASSFLAAGVGIEQEGRLAVLDASRSSEVFALELHGVGLREFAPDWPAQGDETSRFGATLYVERLSFAEAEKQKAFGAGAARGVGAPASTARRAALAARPRSASAG